MNICKEIIVVGGGPAGIAASLAARRNGASFLWLKNTDFLGDGYSWSGYSF